MGKKLKKGSGFRHGSTSGEQTGFDVLRNALANAETAADTSLGHDLAAGAQIGEYYLPNVQPSGPGSVDLRVQTAAERVLEERALSDELGGGVVQRTVTGVVRKSSGRY